MNFDKPGGFRWLDSWVMGSIVQLATHRFCEKFLTRPLDPTGRQYDQMTQAARSGVMNNVEGNERTSTSKETEMKLTNMLGHQLQSQGKKFAEQGGFREKLTEVRVEARAKQEGAPECPECGKPMKKRKAASGPNAGKEFWGCTGYPGCRGVRPV